MKLGVVTANPLGFATVRKRWQALLPETFPDCKFVNIERFERWESKLPYFRSKAWLRAMLAGRRASEAAMRMGCDRLLLTTWHSCAFLAPRAAAKYAMFGDATPHLLDRLYFGKDAFAERRAHFVRRRYRQLAAEGHLFLGMSPWACDDLIETYGIPANRTQVLRPAIDVDRWSPLPETTPGPFTVAFVGGNFERKGGDLLLEALEDPRLRHVQARFATAKPGPSEGRIVFRNDLTADSPELIEFVRTAHLFVLPTIADCSSLASVEASATGLPIIVNPVGGIGDLVEPGVTGQLPTTRSASAFAEAISTYVEDPALAVKHGRAGRARVVERHSFAAHIASLREALSKLG